MNIGVVERVAFWASDATNANKKKEGKGMTTSLAIDVATQQKNLTTQHSWGKEKCASLLVQSAMSYSDSEHA
jgi:hypothetical protein